MEELLQDRAKYRCLVCTYIHHHITLLPLWLCRSHSTQACHSNMRLCFIAMSSYSNRMFSTLEYLAIALRGCVCVFASVGDCMLVCGSSVGPSGKERGKGGPVGGGGGMDSGK